MRSPAELAVNRGLQKKASWRAQAKHTAPDTAVIAVSFGRDAAHIAANVSGIRRQLQQDLRSDYYFVELLAEGDTSILPPDLQPQIRHLAVQASDRCRDLFQKECLMNYGWHEALRLAGYEYFIFVDADLWSEERSWFRQIRDRLLEGPGRLVQGFRVAMDTADPRLLYSSLAARYALGFHTDLPLNPGMCWALHRSLLEAAGGLNPYCIGGGGDSALVAEFLNAPACEYEPWLYRYRWFTEIDRHLPFRAQLDGVPVDIVHEHHGYLKDRHYDPFRYAIEGLPPILEMVAMNREGVLEWNDPGCVARRLLRLRSRMHSFAAVDEIFAELKCDRFRRPDSAPPRFRRERPLFHGMPSREEASRADEPPRAPIPDTAHVFNPQRVFRTDYPFSWCDGVVCDERTHFIPILPNREAPTLVLDGRKEASYIIGVVAVQPNWQEQDLSRFTNLELMVLVSGKMAADVRVQLVSGAEGGEEHESAPISLPERGLRPGHRMRFSIPLSAFCARDGFRLQRVRLVKFIAYKRLRLEISRILLE